MEFLVSMVFKILINTLTLRLVFLSVRISDSQQRVPDVYDRSSLVREWGTKWGAKTEFKETEQTVGASLLRCLATLTLSLSSGAAKLV